MMSKENSVNIITGQIKKQYPLNSTSRRFQSHSEMKKANQNGEYNPQIPAIRKLGTAYDSREFHYTYQNSDIGRLPLKNRVSTEETEKPKTSLINASKLGFNLINHSHEWPKQIGLKGNEANRRAPISRFAHMGRVNAPNYNKDFTEKLQKNKREFNRKRNGCTELCQIEKSYGVQKLFRKFK